MNRLPKTSLALAILGSLFMPFILSAQVDCSPETPYHFVDMTGDADSLYISPLESRDGSCCGSVPPDVCIEFTVILDAAAQGLNFQIVQGAEPPGALFYQIDCGMEIPVGEDICLEGGTAYTLTFCKPGNNPNAYSIQSIPAAIIPDTVITRIGCSVDMSVGGNIVESTITWTDITSGDGSYTDWLSCSTGCDSTTVTPLAGSPDVIEFLICGDVISTLCANTVITVCDTAIVQVVADFEVFIDPDQASVCEDEIQDLTASLTIQDTGFVFYWYESSLIDGPPLDSGTVFTPVTSGTYSVVVIDTNYYGCQVDTAYSEILFNPLPELIFEDSLLLCQGSSTFLQLPPQIDYFWFPQTGITQTNEPGLFEIDPDLTTSYTLTAIDSNGCDNSAILAVEVTFNPVAEAGSDAVLNCYFAETLLDGNGSSSGPLVEYNWSGPPNGILNGADDLNPTIALPGWYILEVTNTYGACTSSDSVFVSEDLIAPIAALPEEGVIDCQTFTTEVTGSGSTTGPGIEFSWFSPDGNILYGSNEMTIGLNEAGTYFLTVTDTNNGCTASDSIFISDPVYPDFTLQPQEIICTGSSFTVSLEPEYSYYWSPSTDVVSGPDSATFVVSPQTDITYTVVAVDSIGCSSTQDISVSLNPLPFSEAGEPDVLNCYDNVGTLEAIDPGGANILFGWTGPPGGIISGANDLDPIVILPGWYFFNVLDLTNGCSAIDSVFVSENFEQPEAITIPESSINCIQFTAVLDGSMSSSGLNFQYQWSTIDGTIIDGSNEANAVAGQEGVYFLTVSDQESGCEDVDTVEVSPPIPPVFSLPSEAFLCSGEQIELFLPFNFQYDWSPSIGVLPGSEPGQYYIQPTQGTEYSVIATDSLGCSSVQSMDVELADSPLALAGDPGEINCLQAIDTLNGAATGGDNHLFSWDGPPGGILNGSNTPNPEVISGGWYYFSVLDLDTGCEGLDSVLVIEDITFPDAILPEDQILECNQDFLLIDGGQSTQGVDIDYDWQTDTGNVLSGQGTPTITVDQGGVYYLIVTDLDNGCASIDTIFIEAEPDIEGGLLSSVGTCYEDTNGMIVVESIEGGEEPYVFALGSGPFSTTNSFSGLPGGAYDVVVQDANGCEWSEQIEVEEYDPIQFNVGADVDLILGESYQLEAFTNLPDALVSSVVWSPPYGLSCTDCLNPIAYPIQNITYSVTLTDVFGCSATDSLFFRVTESDVVYVPNVFSPDGNGNNEIFTVFAGPLVSEVETLKIYDRWGNKVFENSNFPPNDPFYGWDGKFEGKPMNPAVFGFYTVVRLVSGETLFVKGDLTLVR